MSDNESVQMSSPQPQSEQPVKIRKKPGRKPNPASPALRKAQNRAAQRAFRERKEKHMRELEIAIKQIREQRDKLHVENEQLKADQEITRSENWYLKGIVLTLQLVCFQHNLVIPQHGPYINEQALSVLAQSIPESISAYISVNASNKLPIPSKLFGFKHTMKQRDRYLSTGSIVITKEGVHSVSDQQPNFPKPPTHDLRMFDNDMSTTTTENPVHPLETQDDDVNMPPLSPGSIDSETEFHQEKTATPKPIMLTEEPLTSNLAAIQTLRLRLRLQSACVRMDSIPFAIQPTILQLTIPHDPRIDLVPTPHMRDRMILFRDQFDLDDCFRCLLGHSVFHGGDPAIAANWQLPPEFFEKYWFLTIDYDLRRTTNHWRKLQGLSELDFKQQQKQQEEELKQACTENHQPLLEHAHSLNHTDLEALLGVDFCKINQQINEAAAAAAALAKESQEATYASSLSSDSSYNTESSPLQAPVSPTTDAEEDPVSSFEPVRLTNGYSLSYPKNNNRRKSMTIQHKAPRHHPYQTEHKPSPAIKLSSPAQILKNTDTCDPWDTLLESSTSTHQQNYDLMMDNLIDTERTS